MNILWALILFALEASVLGSPLKHDDKRKIPFKPPGHQINIIGGVEATPHSIPYQVALIVNSMMFCGGTMISTRYVVTVAHCTYGMENIVVILGAHDWSCDEDTQVIMYNPTIINHEQYSPTNFSNDISLLKLNRHIPPSAAIRAVPSLASKNSEDFVGCVGRVSGWGYTSTNGDIQSKLRKTYVEIISNQRCIILSLGSQIPPCDMCTLGTDELIGPVGACYGDSGGPLVVGNELVGLVSYGASLCEAGLPTVYTRISYFREWITSHSGI